MAQATTMTSGARALLCALMGLLAVEASAQLANAEPNISGTWERLGGLGGGADSPYVPPREGPPPLKPQYRADYEARRAAARAADERGEPIATHNTFCIPDGMPGMMAGPFPFEILQSPGQVTIVQEAYNQIRRIYLNKPQLPLEEIEPGFYGRSVGQWRDGELHVETLGIKERVRFRDVPHSPAMRITERIRLVAPDVLWDEITIHDPEVLEEPWQVTFAYRRLPDYEILEYVCENNREYADEAGGTRLRIGGPE